MIRPMRVVKSGAAPCNSCGMLATLRSLDIFCNAEPKTKKRPAFEAGWCPLVALCGGCWDDVKEQLAAQATLPKSARKAPTKRARTHCKNGLQCVIDHGSCICLCDGCYDVIIKSSSPEPEGKR